MQAPGAKAAVSSGSPTEEELLEEEAEAPPPPPQPKATITMVKTATAGPDQRRVDDVPLRACVLSGTGASRLGTSLGGSNGVNEHGRSGSGTAKGMRSPADGSETLPANRFAPARLPGASRAQR